VTNIIKRFRRPNDGRLIPRHVRILPAKEILDIQSAASGMHGYRSLEGTFLGGCLFSGRNAGRAAAKAAG
jgi:predicted oxidoreductase